MRTYSYQPEVDTILQLQKAKCGKKHGTKIPLNILWDGGSTLSFITFEKAKQLKLSGEKVKIEIVKVGGDIKLLDSCLYDLYLEDKSGDTTGIEVLGIDAISTDIAEVKLDDIVVMFHELRQSKLDRPNNGNIDCLIGFQYAAFHPVRKQAIGHLLLLENKFGYVIGGSHPKIKEETRKLVKRVKLHFVSARIEDFYSMENLGIECIPKCGACKCGRCHPGGKNMSLKEEREYKQIDDNLRYLEEKKKWQASYPWIRDPAELPNNRCAALARLRSTERRLSKDIQHATLYKRQIQDMINRGVSRRVSTREIDEYNGPIHYISHHAVLKPESKYSLPNSFQQYCRLSWTCSQRLLCQRS